MYESNLLKLLEIFIRKLDKETTKNTCYILEKQ